MEPERLTGTCSVCVACHAEIEPGLSDLVPSVSVCFDCLSADERHALERDLEGAARVQRTLLPPRSVEHDGWEVSWIWEPHGAVSGDHVDLMVPASPEEPLHLLLGDVAGKGVAASLLQSHLHALFRALTTSDLPLAELLSKANRLFNQATASASYATLIAARLSADGILELANAGHPRPLIADRRGVRPVEGSGLPLGMFPEASFPEHRIELGPGEVALFYTDGLTEAARPGDPGGEAADEEYGIGRAAASLRRATRDAGDDATLPGLLRSARADVDAFLAGAPRGDDLTLLAVRRRS
jgi:sigma-B regulation protein RsbU (phosphoserine phosphatase)